MLKRASLLSVLALLLAQTTGCYLSPRAASGLARAAVVTTLVAANVAIMASHDAHFHGHGCGHHHRWHNGQVVYYYGGHWEYYDHGRGGWYYVVD